MNKKTLFSLSLAAFAAFSLQAFSFQQKEKNFIVSGKRVELTVSDGTITSIRNRQNGALLTTPDGVKMNVAGLGNMTGKAKEMSSLHFPWGEPTIKQHRKRKKTTVYGLPGKESKVRVKKNSKSAVVSWQGLYYNGKFSSQDSITFAFSEDANGSLVLKRSGKGREGIFGIAVPVNNLAADGKITVPSFGGLEYAAKSGQEELIGLQNTTLFFEAPLMIYTRNDNAFGMWIEDKTFRPYYGFIERTPKGCAFTLESQNIMPYEKLNSIGERAVKFDVFADSGWIAAARPYRNWYQKTFAEEIAIRDAKNWADKIFVIADGGNKAPGFRNLLKGFKPENVLVQIWQARKLGFTTGIPDYTPRGHYPGLVKDLHKAGFKVMCYVCSLCAVYKCDAWNKDNVGSFFLTRKNSITNYHGNKNAFDENLAGTIRAAKGKDQFGHLKKGAFLYGDPLSKGWRDYFCKTIRHMNDTCGTDANYQDTLGCTADTGNGYIDGYSGAQGNWLFTRDLQKKVGVPMAAEFGPEAIAMGIRWPLNNAHGWGGPAFRRYRMHHHVPLTAFIFGYRTWVPSIRLYSDDLVSVVLSVSDALSGFGMISTSSNIDSKTGFWGQMALRAKLFANRELRPYYPQKKYPRNIKSMYKDKDGKIYRYYDDGKLQKMLSPDGKAVYARLSNASQLLDKELFIPGYPAWDKDGIYGLDPKRHYALLPRSGNTPPLISTGKLPANVNITSYYEMPEYAYLELTSKDKNKVFKLDLKVASKYRKILLNGVEKSISGTIEIKTKMPAKIVFFTGKTVLPQQVIFVNRRSGMKEGKVTALPAPRLILKKRLYDIGSAGSKLLNMLVKVPGKDSAIELSMINLQKRYGDGCSVTLLVNGNAVQSFDCAKWNGKGSKKENNYIFDNRMRTWKVPVGKYAGQHIFVTVKVDYKNGSNADQQFVSKPVLIKDSAQKFSEKIMFLVDRRNTRPVGEPQSVITPEWRAKDGLKNTKGALLTQGLFKLDPAMTYHISGKFKSVDGKPVRVFFGMIQYDKKGQIHGVHVNPVTDSETTLSHEAKKGDTSLMVFDASKWNPRNVVVLGAAKDQSDLPNRKMIGTVKSVKLMGGDYKVTLTSPLKANIPSESPVRVHTPRSTFEFVKIIYAQKDFAAVSGTIDVLPKAEKAALVIITPKPVYFKDIKIEVFPVKK